MYVPLTKEVRAKHYPQVAGRHKVMLDVIRMRNPTKTRVTPPYEVIKKEEGKYGWGLNDVVFTYFFK